MFASIDSGEAPHRVRAEHERHVESHHPWDLVAGWPDLNESEPTSVPR